MLCWRSGNAEKSTAKAQNYRSDKNRVPSCHKATSQKHELHAKMIPLINKKEKRLSKLLLVLFRKAE